MDFFSVWYSIFKWPIFQGGIQTTNWELLLSWACVSEASSLDAAAGVTDTVATVPSRHKYQEESESEKWKGLSNQLLVASPRINHITNIMLSDFLDFLKPDYQIGVTTWTRTIKDSEAGFWMSLRCRVGNDNRRRGRSGNTLCVLDRRNGHSFQSPSISPFRGDRWQADMATQILAYLFLEIPLGPHTVMCGRLFVAVLWNHGTPPLLHLYLLSIRRQWGSSDHLSQMLQLRFHWDVLLI